MTTGHAVVTTEVMMPGDGGEMQTWVSRPDSPGRFPALVMLHPSFAPPNDDFRNAAVRLAGEGFTTVAYNWMTHERDPSDSALLTSLEECARYLAAQPYVEPEQLAIAGFCGGGVHALLTLARLSNFTAGVLFHGGAFRRELTPEHPVHPFDLASDIDAPVLMLHGAADTISPIEKIYEFATRMNELGKEFELKVYSGTDHAFVMPGSERYREQPSEDAYRETVSFLRRIYGGA